MQSFPVCTYKVCIVCDAYNGFITMSVAECRTVAIEIVPLCRVVTPVYKHSDNDCTQWRDLDSDSLALSHRCVSKGTLLQIKRQGSPRGCYAVTNRARAGIIFLTGAIDTSILAFVFF